MELQNRQEHERFFAATPVTKLFFKCSIPSIISMTAASLYTIADGIFVGRFIGSGALAAVNLVMPVIMMSFALSDMIAVGSSVQISIQLGMGDEKKASLIFTSACKMILAIAVLTGLGGWLLAPYLVEALGAKNEVARMAVSYMRVYSAWSPLIMGFFAMDNYLRICGRVRYSMWMNLFISIANIFFDWLFIVKFKGGIGSAALASCICLTAGNVICLLPFFKKKLILKFTGGRLSACQTANIFTNGSSEFFSNISGSVCMMLFNAALMRISGYLAVAAFSIVMYVDSVIKSVLFGMSDSLQPAVSYNYGSGNVKRVLALERRVQTAALLISIAVMLWMQYSGESVIRLFSPDDSKELQLLSIRAMKLFSFSYLVSWCGTVCGSFFTALNRPAFSLAVSFCQTLIFPAVFLLILPAALGLDGVWLTSCAAGGLAAALSGLLFWQTVRGLKKTLVKS